ncbi:MAG TPA: hypothetical protein PLY66_01920 [Acidobacteriota bacterium]|nr:hypothetical protein [Acidobacteriota bacterium]HQF86043.1 hypothetical protein [Acidobacteriota bacterium]HQG90714.1 hypothetical protein [Acidobacteriota bacterium]HQK86019.1 hypothetical protein [Acidobacteriota bacterium]
MLSRSLHTSCDRLLQPLARLSERPRLVALVLLLFFFAQLAVIAIYQPWQNPDTWQLGFEVGRIARNVALGYGYGSPFVILPGDVPPAIPASSTDSRPATVPPAVVVNHPPIPPTAYVTPPIVLVWAAVFALFGPYSPVSMFLLLALQCGFMTLAVFLLHRTLTTTLGPRAGGLGLVLLITYPLSWFGTQDMRGEILFLLFLSLSLFASLAYLRGRRFVHLAVHAAGSALAVLTMPKTLFFFVAYHIWMMLRLRRDAPAASAGRSPVWWHYVATVALAACLSWSPWIVFASINFQRPVLFGTGLSMQFWLGNNPTVPANPHRSLYANFPYENQTERLLILNLGETEYARLCWRRFFDFVRDQPLTYVWLTARRIFAYWVFNPDYLRPTRLLLIPWYLAYMALAATGPYRIGWRNWNPLEQVIVIFFAFFPIVHFLSQCNVYRYRSPHEMLLVVLVASVAARFCSRADLSNQQRPTGPTADRSASALRPVR